MDVVVFGAGSLGSLIGGLLAREHPVTLVGREAHVRAVRENGLRIAGEIDAIVHPRATTDVPDSATLAIVTVKAYDTDRAVEALAGCDLDAVLSLQNGLGNEDQLATLEATVLAGTATYGAIRDDPGTVRCTGLGEVVLGSPDGGRSRTADRVGDAFATAGIETTVAPDMPRRLWEKLAVNAGINATTALSRVTNGALAAPPLATVSRRAARETARVARDRGVDLSGETTVDALESVVAATADNESSMYRDVQAGRRTEVDAINGYVADSDVETPINDTLAALLRGWERERELRD